MHEYIVSENGSNAMILSSSRLVDAFIIIESFRVCQVFAVSLNFVILGQPQPVKHFCVIIAFAFELL